MESRARNPQGAVHGQMSSNSFTDASANNCPMKSESASGLQAPRSKDFVYLRRVPWMASTEARGFPSDKVQRQDADANANVKKGKCGRRKVFGVFFFDRA